jgi:hypothetical protein
MMVLGAPEITYSQSALDGFDPNPNTRVHSIAVQVDGKILIWGEFTTIGVETRNYIARLNPDGSLDTGFNPNANNSVDSFAVQADGKILVGGGFTTIGGVTRNRIARLKNTDPALQELRVSSNGSTVTWMRGQASPELWRVTVEHSPDAVTSGQASAMGRGSPADGSLPGFPFRSIRTIMSGQGVMRREATIMLLALCLSQ